MQSQLNISAGVANGIVTGRVNATLNSIGDLDNPAAFPGLTRTVMQQIADEITVTTGGYRTNVCNINTAPPEVLAALPNMNSNIYTAIMQARQAGTVFVGMGDIFQLTQLQIADLSTVCADLCTKSLDYLIRVRVRFRGSPTVYAAEALVELAQPAATGTTGSATSTSLSSTTNSRLASSSSRRSCSTAKSTNTRAGVAGLSLRRSSIPISRLPEGLLSAPSPGTTRRPSHRSRVVAIDMGHTAVRAVEVELSGDSARLLKRGVAPLAARVWDDPGGAKDQISHAIKQALSSAGITATHVVACVPRRLVTIKYATLPAGDPDDVRSMVEFEAQQYIPFPMDEVVIDHQIVSESGDDMATVMIVAARRLLVEDLLSAFDKAGLEVSLLSVSSLGLAEHARNSTLPEALLEVEPGEIDIAVVGGGRLLFTRAASLLESADTPGGIHLLAGEVVRSLSAYQNENRGQPVSKLLVASQNGQLEAIQDALSGVIEAPILAAQWPPDAGRRPGRPALRNRDGPGAAERWRPEPHQPDSLVARRAQGGRPAPYPECLGPRRGGGSHRRGRLLRQGLDGQASH